MAYALVNTATLEVPRATSNFPPNFSVPERGKWKRIKSPAEVGDEYTNADGETYRLVNVAYVDQDRPAQYADLISKTPSLSGNTLTFTYTWDIWDQTRIDAHEDAQETADVEKITGRKVGKALFQIVNQVRDLNSQSPLTVAQFKNWLKSL